MASRRNKNSAPHAERTSQNAIDSHHTPAFLGILGVTPRQKPALHLERGRMKTFWTNLPLTIRAAVIFCYAYAAVRILNLFYEAGTAPLTPRTLLDGALTVALASALSPCTWVTPWVPLYAPGEKATSPARSASSSPTRFSWRCAPTLSAASSPTPWRRGSPGSSRPPSARF